MPPTPIEKLVRDVVEKNGDKRVTVEVATILDENSDPPKFRAFHYLIYAGHGENKEFLVKVVDKRSWPVRIEQQHADASLTTNYEAPNGTAITGLLIGILESKETAELLERVPPPAPPES